MAFYNPNSSHSIGSHNLSVTGTSSNTVIIRPGIYITAEGPGSSAIFSNSSGAFSTYQIDGLVATDAGTGIDLTDAARNQITIGESGSVTSGSTGIAGTGIANMITNNGAITAYLYGISAAGGTAGNLWKIVNSGSITTNSTSIYANTGALITNSGTISSESTTIQLGTSVGNSAGSMVINSGDILAETYGVLFYSPDTLLDNSGTIASGNRAVQLQSNAINVSFINSGRISSRDDAVYSSAVDGTYTNSGAVSADGAAFQFNAESQLLLNRGTIVGGTYGVLSVERLTLENTGEIFGDTFGVYAQSDGLPSNDGYHEVSNTGIIGGLGGGVIMVGDDLKLTNGIGGVIESNGDVGAQLLGNDAVLSNNGSITGGAVAIDIDSNGAVITNGGQVVSGGVGISVSGGGTITNSGDIAAENFAIDLSTGTNTTGILANTGTVTSRWQTAVQIRTEAGRLTNTGAIDGYTGGVLFMSATGSISNEGTISGQSFGLLRGNSYLTNAPVHIQNSGSLLSAGNALEVRGDDIVDNSGTISGNVALLVGNDHDGLGMALITNSGMMSAVTEAAIFADASTDSSFVNTGTVQGGYSGVRYYNLTADTFLLNEGEIAGGSYSVIGNAGVNEVRNAGRLVGDLVLGDGADVVEGLGGTIEGLVQAGDGADRIYLGDDDGLAEGNGGADIMMGRGGNDTLIGGDGADTLGGGLGDDDLNGGAANDLLSGGDGADTILGGDGNDTILGGDGNDNLQGNRNDDFIVAGAGDDIVDAGYESDTISGGQGNDTLDGSRGADLVMGGEGNDSLIGGDANDTLAGGSGDDVVNGDGGNDQITGGTGNDVLNGGDGADSIYGNDGADILNGGSGLDRLDGGWGNDILTGGTLADVFVFIPDNGVDEITDFENNIDLIDLTAFNTSYGAMSSAISDLNGGALIDFSLMGGSGSVWVKNTPASFLNNNDFIF